LSGKWAVRAKKREQERTGEKRENFKDENYGTGRRPHSDSYGENHRTACLAVVEGGGKQETGEEGGIR